MIDKESLKQTYRQLFEDWSEEKIDEYASWMTDKYSTVKEGPNVIHLNYYSSLITDEDIQQIESNISKAGLELSRFDKDGVVYNSIEDFTLQASISLSDPIVQSILVGLGSNVLWDTIKQSSFFVWTRLKSRLWSIPKQERKSNINFGLCVHLGNKTRLNLKMDGDVSEQMTLEALDKVIDFLKSTRATDTSKNDRFIIYDYSKNC